MFSVIIPIFNVEEYLGECLRSVSALNPQKYEIIAVNDGSTDSSAEILNEWSESMTNLKIVTQDNKGLSAARNTGLRHAKGKYVAFIDSDDKVDAAMLDKMFRVAESNQVDICVGDYVELYDNINADKVIRHLGINENTLYTGSDFLQKYHTLLMSMVWRSIYQRRFLEANSLYFVEGIYFEDVVYTPLCFQAARRVKYLSLPFYTYRKRDNSITTTKGSRKKVEDAIVVWSILRKNITLSKLVKIADTEGFHAFLKQYMLYGSEVDNALIAVAREYSKSRNLDRKYKIAGVMLRLLPQSLFRKIYELLS